MSLRRVVITGVGAVTSLGHNVPDTWSGILWHPNYLSVGSQYLFCYILKKLEVIYSRRKR